MTWTSQALPPEYAHLSSDADAAGWSVSLPPNPHRSSCPTTVAKYVRQLKPDQMNAVLEDIFTLGKIGPTKLLEAIQQP